MKLKIVLFFLFLSVVTSKLNNACNNYWSYLYLHYSSDCYHIPDNHQDPPEIIKYHTGASEIHEVTTEDGHILTLFRIPRANAKGVILLQHPLGEDSRIWLAQYKESTALMFWTAGYDVWLGNNRGTSYSQKHVNLSTSSEQFWNFSLHEFGYYDCKSFIDYIKNYTNEPKIIYVGHSMGTTIGYIYASTRPEEASNSLKVIVNLAPCVFFKHNVSPVSYMARFVSWAKYFSSVFGFHSTCRHNSWNRQFLRFFNVFFPFKKLLLYAATYDCGWTFDEFNPNYFNLLVDQTASETSWKVIDHYSQLITAKDKFQRYDYGQVGNMELYGQNDPLEYTLEDVRVPVFMVISKDDTMCSYKDAEMLYDRLQHHIKPHGKMVIEGFSHLDFHFGSHKFEVLYDHVLQLLERI